MSVSSPRPFIQQCSLRVSAVILEAAGHDPRYLLLLPGLFTAPEGDPYPNIADNLDALFIAEEKYPAGLRRCQSVSSLDLPPINRFAVFNPCLQLDARGITPFLPYVIRGDLHSLLDVDKSGAFALEDVVSLLIHHTDSLLTFLQVGNQSSLNDVNLNLGVGASPDREDPSPVRDTNHFGNPYCNFKTIIMTTFLVIPMSIILGVFATYFLGFYQTPFHP